MTDRELMHEVLEALDICQDGVWLHTFTANGSMHVTLTKEQAKELIAALEQVIA